MITSLCDANNNLITDIVSNATLVPDIIKIKNRLLDGTYHIQTIGNRIDTIQVECYVDIINKAKIDDMYTIDEPVKLLVDGKYYIGLMEDKPEQERFSKYFYVTNFNLVVSGEGSI